MPRSNHGTAVLRPLVPALLVGHSKLSLLVVMRFYGTLARARPLPKAASALVVTAAIDAALCRYQSR